MADFFDILFSIKICVQQNKLKHREDLENFFEVEPTNACEEVFKQYGLRYKKLANGGLVIQEKRGENRANAKAIQTIDTLTLFTFQLYIKDKSLLSNLDPYVEKENIVAGLDIIVPTELEPAQPAGTRRIFYYDNLNDSNAIKTVQIDSKFKKEVKFNANNELIRESDGKSKIDVVKIIPISQAVTQSDYNTNEKDIASTLPNLFVPEDAGNTKMFAISVGSTGEVNQNLPDDISPLPYYILEEGAYRLENTTTSMKEIVFASSEVNRTDAIGVIQISLENDDSTANPTTTLNYEILFNLITID